MQGSPAMSKVGRCPACQYDLTGAPGPICPECGIDAVAEHERRLALARSVRRAISPDWLIPPALFLLTIFPFLHFIDGGRRYDGQPLTTGAGMALPIMLLWLWYSRERVLGSGSLWRLVLYAVFTSSISWLIMVASVKSYSTWRSYYNLDTLIVTTCASVMLTTCVWISTRGRALWTLLLYAGLAILLPGLGLAAYDVCGRIAGHEWSPFSDPRIGQVYDQYPLRWDEVRLVAPAVVAIGAAMVASGIWARRGSARSNR